MYPKEGGISDDTKPQYGVMSSSSIAVVFLIRNAKGEVVGVFVSLVVTHETFLVSRMTEYCCPAMAPALYSMCNAYGKRDLMAYDVGINSNSGFFPKPNERKY